VLATLVTSAALLAPPAGYAPDVAAARAYAADRPGTVAFAVRTERRLWGTDADRAFPSASVLKAMLLVAYSRAARDRPLRADERALLAPMVRWSDSAAASTIFVRLGAAALQRLARSAGMTSFRAASPIWGNSLITARDATRLFLRIDALLPRRHRAYALRLLRQIVPSQRWGIGALKLPSWRVYFKGGWGSGSGAVDHQVALLRRGDERVAVAVFTAANGSHATGKETLEGVFRRLLNGLRARGTGWSRPAPGSLSNAADRRDAVTHEDQDSYGPRFDRFAHGDARPRVRRTGAVFG
jgi:beta-lactamase class A